MPIKPFKILWNTKNKQKLTTIYCVFVGSALRYVPDNDKHGTIQPATTMPFDDYVNALSGTQDKWRIP